NSSEMWLVDRIKPNYKKTQRSSSEKQTDFNTKKPKSSLEKKMRKQSNPSKK
ncbi:hypothetical protein L9F63_021027, partial [Diploptera punctata]